MTSNFTDGRFIFVDEGWWHPNVKKGQVHDHTDNQPATMHRLCEPVYTRRDPSPRRWSPPTEGDDERSRTETREEWKARPPWPEPPSPPAKGGGDE